MVKKKVFSQDFIEKAARLLKGKTIKRRDYNR